MRKLIFCLVAATLYLNPLYPVYAASDANSSITQPEKMRLPEPKKLEEERMKIASKAGEVRAKVDDRKMNIASRVGEIREKMASREAALKEKLAQFKDKIKATKTEQVNNTLKLINEKRTLAMKNHLDALTKVLGKIEDRVNEAGTSGTNVDVAKSAIASARTALQTATTNVEEQSKKDYTIEVSSESTVKADAQVERNSLFNDLKSTQEVVKQAKEAVQNALQAAKEAMGVNGSPNASSSN